MLIDVKDIFGKVHYFVANAICTIDEVEIPLEKDIDPQTGKPKKLSCWEITFVNQVKFFIDEETRNMFIQPDVPNQPKPEQMPTNIQDISISEPQQNLQQDLQEEPQLPTLADLHTVQPSEVIEILDDEEPQLVEVGA